MTPSLTVTESESTSPGTLAVPGRSISRQILWLGGPVLVEQILLYLVGFSDTVLTGRYLEIHDLAAVTVSAYLMWFLGSLMMIVSAGGTALVARLVGAGEREDASRVTQQAIGLAWVAGVLLLLLGWVFVPALARLLQLEPDAAAQATIYMRIVLAITPLLASEVVGVACLRGAGDTRTGMWVMAIVNIVNAALSWALVVGFAGLPKLGLAGVAIGTAAGEGLGGVIVLALLARGRSGLKLSLRGLIPVRSWTRRILRISVPAAAESFVNGICQLWFLGLVNRLGATATAAHGVAIRSEAIAFLTLAAFAIPASTLTGQYLGSRRPDLAERAARDALWMALAITAVSSTLLYWQAAAMFQLFLGRSQPDVAALGVPVLRIVAFGLPALAVIAVLSAALRGAGDTRAPLAIVLAGYLLVRMPLTYCLTGAVPGGLNLGLRGAWYAMLADLLTRGTLVAWRFSRGRWKAVRV